MSKGYLVRKLSEVEPVPCLCGSSTRPITRADTPAVNFHVTHIQDSLKHYHRYCTEVYFILEGSGKLELGEDEIELEPGVVVLIEPGTAHRGKGDFRAVIVGAPAQDPADEVIV
jgi:mannose-6-phosphate isomerase-like protein (cupin superfamily)